MNVEATQTQHILLHSSNGERIVSSPSDLLQASALTGYPCSSLEPGGEAKTSLSLAGQSASVQRHPLTATPNFRSRSLVRDVGLP